MAHEGIDVSSHQHPNGAGINYQAAVDDLRSQGGGATPFVIVKITEGNSYVNPFWRQDVQGFATAGAAVGGYIFDSGAVAPGAEETKARSVVGPGLPLVVDAEDPHGLSPAQYRDHILAVVSQEPVKIEYLNQSQVAAGELSPGVWLWLADYNPSPHYPCRIHQYTNGGSLVGVTGTVDRDRWMGSEDEFALLFHHGPIPPPPAFPGRMLHFPPTMTGSDVNQWQARMAQLGWPIVIDGSYGPHSAEVCRQFQAKSHLTVDGIVGPITWAASWTAA